MNKVFNKHYAEYDAWFDKNHKTYLSELKLLKSLLPQQGVGLEIGVGSGRFAGPLGIHYGIDPSLQMLKLAKLKKIKTLKASAEKIPLPANQYDFVLLVTTICFLKNIPKAFREIHRILKPNGQLLIGFVDKASFLGQYYLKRKTKSIFYKTATFYSVQEVLTILNKFDFKLVKIKQTLFNLPQVITNIEKIKSGHGQGGFVGILAKKNSVGRGEATYAAAHNKGIVPASA